MDRAGTHNSLVERILSAAGPVVVVRGPAASGKTTAALAIYRHHLDEAARPRCLLLVPNAPAAMHLRRALTAADPGGVLLSPAVLTFAAFAGRVLADADEPARPVSAFRRQLLLGAIVAELARADRLAALGAVADTPGLVATLDRAIAELKRAAVEPEDLASAVGGAPGKHADLVEVYRCYQQRLSAAGGYDEEGRMWLARNHMAPADSGRDLPGLAGVDAVVADGFTDFTPTQLEMLRLAAARLRRVVITLPYADDGRERMWHWTARTLATLRDRFGDRLEEIDAEAHAADPASPPAQPPLRVLWDGLFDLDARCPLPEGLSVIAAAGVDAEVAAVARRVKALLVEGAAAGSIALLARSLETYREPIERIFAEHDIPVAPVPQPLRDVPIVRFLLDAAALGPDFPWRDCLRVVTSSYFRPQALGEYDEATVAAAETVLREGNVLAGRDAYVEAAERLAARADRDEAHAEADPDDDDRAAPALRRPSADALHQAGRMLARLFDVSAAAADPRRLLDLVEALQLRAAACGQGEPELIARDLRALAALEDVLAELPSPPPDAARLRAALGAAACPAARHEALVDVLDVLDARALRYEHVFLLGVSERQFPQRVTEGSLIGEADRSAWADRGVRLDARSDLTAREMLLFYLAVSRAGATLTASYLESDAAGRAGAPSSFLLSLLAPVGGLEKAPREQIPPGRFVPPPGEIASRRDALNAAFAGLFRPDSAGLAGAPAWAAERQEHTLRRAARGLWASHRRWLPGPCNEFDGRITDRRLLDALRARCPAQTVFSAGRLNVYGQCPWQYFGTYVLRLAPPVEPQRRLEPRTRGLFCHGVLYRLMRLLGQRLGEPVRLDAVDERVLGEVLDEAVAAEAEAVEARPPTYPALWQIQRRRMRQQLWDYLLAARGRGELHSESVHFELAFGQEVREQELRDPASRDEPVTLATPAGEIRLRGRIDRVDRVRFEGAEGLLIVDYKTGRLPRKEDVLAGRSMQLPLYAAAAEAILGGPCLGGAFHGIGSTVGGFERLFAAVELSRGRARYKHNAAYEAGLAAVYETVGRFVEGMRNGRFDALPTHDCPGYCPFRQVCQYAPARAERKVEPDADARQEDRP